MKDKTQIGMQKQGLAKAVPTTPVSLGQLLLSHTEVGIILHRETGVCEMLYIFCSCVCCLIGIATAVHMNAGAFGIVAGAILGFFSCYGLMSFVSGEICRRKDNGLD